MQIDLTKEEVNDLISYLWKAAQNYEQIAKNFPYASEERKAIQKGANHLYDLSNKIIIQRQDYLNLTPKQS